MSFISCELYLVQSYSFSSWETNAPARDSGCRTDKVGTLGAGLEIVMNGMKGSFVGRASGRRWIAASGPARLSENIYGWP